MSDKFQDISLILKDLLKVIKVVSMYPEDNSLPQSMKRSFSEKLESIVEEYNASAKHGISIVQDKAMLGRNINTVLGIMDRIVSWNIAIKSFSKSIAANKNSASVGTDMIFKPGWS